MESDRWGLIVWMGKSSSFYDEDSVVHQDRRILYSNLYSSSS